MRKTWAKEKYLLLSKSQNTYKQIREYLKTEPKLEKLKIMIAHVQALPEQKTEVINAFQHIWGYFKKECNPEEKRDFFERLSAYKSGLIEKEELICLIQIMLNKYPNLYLENSSIIKGYHVAVEDAKKGEKMLEIGIKGREEVIVGAENSAKTLGSGTLDVFATPAMITLMEKTAWKSVQDHLEEGFGTVGISLNVKHLAATPFGMKVHCESELIAIDGKKLTFTVKAFDEAGLIGEGSHERFIVDNEKFQEKTNRKRV